MDRSVFSNAKISRWQERLSMYNFVIQYIEGGKNQFADMFSRPLVNFENKINTDKFETLGKFYEVENTPIKVYVPSWTLELGKLQKNLILTETEQYNALSLMVATNDEFCKNAPIQELFDIALEQRKDSKLIALINYIENNVKPEILKFDLKDEYLRYYSKFRNQFKIEKNTGVLLIDNGSEKICIPRALVAHYLKICHDETGHFGHDRTKYFLRNTWWPCKEQDIESYVNSCENCIRRKGSYMQSAKPPFKHLNHGLGCFTDLTIDFVHMTRSKRGKKYILTIMCNFSR